MSAAADGLQVAADAYERAVFGGDATAVGTGLAALELLDGRAALARGRLLHAAFLAGEPAQPAQERACFERAVAAFDAAGRPAELAEAAFWLGCLHQVVDRDHDAARPHLERARDLATDAGEPRTLSYALRHLAIADHVEGRLAPAREQLEASTALRRQLGFGAGVAANLVGLAHLAMDEGRGDDAAALLAEATALTDADDARGVRGAVDEARARLGHDGGAGA